MIASAIPGLEDATPRRRNLDNTAEIDLAFRVTSECPVRSFGSALAFECKNQGTKLAAGQVTRFAEKLKDAHLRGGVMVTLSGVSGSDEDLKAARGALNKSRASDRGIVIVVLEQSELEAVASGEHLAAALERKFMMMSLYGRHEIIPAKDLQHPEARLLKGVYGIRKAVNDSRRTVLDEILERSEARPPDAAAGADSIRTALDDVSHAVDVANDQDDEMWAGPRAALIGVARLCVAQLAVSDPQLHGAGPRAIRINIMTHIPEQLPVQLGRSLWRTLTDHFVDELRSEEAARASAAALTIAGLAADRIAGIDDYRPEPPDIRDHSV